MNYTITQHEIVLNYFKQLPGDKSVRRKDILKALPEIKQIDLVLLNARKKQDIIYLYDKRMYQLAPIHSFKNEFTNPDHIPSYKFGSFYKKVGNFSYQEKNKINDIKSALIAIGGDPNFKQATSKEELDALHKKYCSGSLFNSKQKAIRIEKPDTYSKVYNYNIINTDGVCVSNKKTISGAVDEAVKLVNSTMSKHIITKTVKIIEIETKIKVTNR